ncbi:MAG: hypothetical protein AB2L14_09215 [Candidatus Xenobiia bacterium LiM19]
MEIGQNRPTGEGMHIGGFAEEREKIVKEASPGLQKIDSFSSSERNTVNIFGDVAKNLLDIFSTPAAADSKPLPASSLQMDGYMIPCNEGKISHMTLTCGMLGNARQNYLDALKTFIAEMPTAKFTILTSSKGDAKELKDCVQEWAREGSIKNPERVTLQNTDKHLSIWAQDSTLVVGNKVIEQDRMWFPGSGDGAVAQELAKADSSLKYQKMEGIFVDGGNQLATRDTIYVGSDAIAFMQKDMKSYPSKYNKLTGDLGIAEPSRMSHEELSKLMLDRTFPNQKVVIVGYKGQQPSFHIDMAMTPLGKTDPETGKKVMVVGDPSLATKILKDIKAESPEKYKQYEADIQKKLGWAPDRPLDKLVDNVGDDKDLQENFDALAKGFEKDGFKIERVPYLGSSSLRNEPWITYNNLIFDGDNLFIPNFGIPEMDTPSNEVFRKYGYNPIPIDMNAISSLQGAINCITKVVERNYA